MLADSLRFQKPTNAKPETVACNAMRLLNPFIFLLILGCNSRQTSSVTTLDLSNKNLTGIPDSVFSLTQLEHLDLGNSFTLYPPLSILGPASSDSPNKITDIPKEIMRLRHLQTLGLCFNDLRSLPKEIVELKKLDTLDISFNENFNLASQLETLTQMQWLKYLNIIAINSDGNTIDKLRNAMPTTKIYARLEDLKIDKAETSE